MPTDERVAIKMLFDDFYGSTDRYWWKQPSRYSTNPDDYPQSLLTQLTLRLVHTMPPGRALDLGSGEGADAIRLAKLGWTVDAVELSRVGAEKIERFADEEGVHVAVFNQSAQEFVPSGTYELIICNGVVHYVADKRSFIERMQDWTTPNGLHVVSTWSDYTPVPDCHQVVPTFPEPEEGVLTSAYADWDKYLWFFERKKPEVSHDNFDAHEHSYIKMIARKPAIQNQDVQR